MFNTDEEQSTIFQRKNSPYFPSSLSLKDFKPITYLASGAFGSVSQYEYKNKNQYYAIKKMEFKDRKNYKLIKQIQRQIDLLYRIQSQYIIKLYDHFEDQTSVYLVMEFVDGSNLYDSILKKPKKNLRMPIIARMINQICLGLEQLHSHHIVHRDLKLQNIMITQSSIKIIDLGESNHYGDEINRDTKRGTKTYFCPEIINGDQQDDKVDVWCLGVILYELTCLKSPFYDAQENQLYYKIKVNNENIEEISIRYSVKYQKRKGAFKPIWPDIYLEGKSNLYKASSRTYVDEKYILLLEVGYYYKQEFKIKQYDMIFGKSLKYEDLMSEEKMKNYRNFLEGQIEKYQGKIFKISEENQFLQRQFKISRSSQKEEKSQKKQNPAFNFEDF